MFESIAANLATNVLVLLWGKVNETFAGSKTDFEKELTKVIYESLEAYEKTAPKPASGRIPFYLSQAFLTELLSFRFFEQLRIEEVKRVVEKDARILPPSEEELIKFFEIFDSKISDSEKLIELNIENNYKSEIFRISSSLQELFSELLNKLDYIKDDIKSTIQDSKLSDILKREWNTQIDEITENLRKFKPYTAKERLEQLEKRVNEKKGFLDQNLKAKFLFLKALCLQEISLSGEEDRYSSLFIQAWKLNKNALNYKTRAAFSYIRLEDFSNADKLASEILLEDEYNQNAWMIKCVLPDQENEFYRTKVPKIIQRRFSFRAIVGNWLLIKGKVRRVTDLKELNLEINFQDVEIPENITFENKNQWIVAAQICLAYFSEKHPVNLLFIGNQNAKSDKLFDFTNVLLGRITEALKESELENNYSNIFLQYHYTSFQKTDDLSSAQKMELTFQKIDKKSPQDVFQLIQVLIIAGEKKNGQKVLKIIEDYGEEKHEILSYTKCVLHYVLEEYDASWRSFLEYLKLAPLINNEWLCNIFNYLKLALNRIENEGEKLKYIFENYEFEKPEYRDFFLVYVYAFFNEKLEPFDLDEKIDRLQLEIKEDFLVRFLAEVFIKIEFYAKAKIYLKAFIEPEKFDFLLKKYCEALFRSKSNMGELVGILKKWRLNGKPDSDLLRTELSIRLKQRNRKEVYEISKNGILHFPEDEDFLSNYFSSMDYFSKSEEIGENIELIKRFRYNYEETGLAISRVLFKNGFKEEARNLLYPFAKREENTKARQMYFGLSTYSDKELFSEVEKVDIDTCVILRINGKNEKLYIQESNRNKFVVKQIFGNGVGFKFTTKSGEHEGEILRIMDKYLALFAEIEEEIGTPLSELDFKKIELEQGFSLEDFHKKIIELYGAKEDEKEAFFKEKIQLFSHGELSFTEISYQVFGGKNIEAYHYLTSGLEGIRFTALSAGLAKDESISKNSRFILDATSACLFYELNKELKIEFTNKFIVTGLFRQELVALIDEIAISPETKMSVKISSKGILPQFYPEDYKERRLKYFQGFLSWIDSNCEVDYVDEKLNFLLELNENKKGNFESYGFFDPWILTLREHHILLSSDSFYFRNFGYAPDKIISPEVYLNHFHSKKEVDFSKMMIEKKYVGITIHHQILIEEYHKFLLARENSFILCLQNLQFSWNPNLSNIHHAVLFLKEVCLPSFIRVDTKNRIAIRVFSNLLKGMDQNQKIDLKMKISREFMGLDFLFKLMVASFESAIRFKMEEESLNPNT